MAAVFIMIAVLIQLITVIRSQNRLVFQDSFDYSITDPEKSRVTEIFELRGRPSNVVVNTNARVSNSWIYFNMALINDDTGTAYDFGREIGYYFGTDSDGDWTEGRQSDQATILSVPAGRYYLRIEPEGSTPAQYSVQIYRDVPSWWPFFATLAALAVVPAVAFWRSRSFEYKRWSESDHPMVSISSLGDDDE
jgi:hypothetical protein